MLAIIAALSYSAPAQEQDQNAQPMTLDRTLATLHGVVRNAATGEGLPRALVRVEGDAATGALTDGDGRFEIPDILVGPQQVEVTRPGFLDRGFSGSGAVQGFILAMPGGGHNVMVAAGMPDVVFTLAPTGAIRGQVELSTGDAAEGITVALVRRTIADGRAAWQTAASTKTRSDGTYRFGGLADGEYAVYTQPAMDSDLDEAPGAAGGGQRWGYASVYYPDARDPSGAARIRVASGEEVQANLTLTLEPFQAVTATIVLPDDRMAASGKASNQDGDFNSAVIMDAAGHELPYQATKRDVYSHTVRTFLPDGSYVLFASYATPLVSRNGTINRDSGPLAGIADFSVAGHAVPDLRVPLSAWHVSPVQLTSARSSPPAAQSGTAQGREPALHVMVSQAAGWIDDSMVSAYANGALPGPLEAAYTKPGSYWVHTHIPQTGLCESSFTAGGANLAREPVVIGVSGSTAPMELTLRDDCAALTLSLPDALDSIAAGEEPFFTVYVVPDFDSTVDVEPMTLRPSTGGTVTMNSLTPGSYHVYTFAGAVQLEYRNRDALASLKNPGQAITLTPGATGNLVVEAPGP